MKRSRGLVLVAAAVLALGVGCAKKKVAQQQPPAPAPAETPRTQTTPAPERHEVASTPRREEPAPRSNMPDAATRKRIDDLLARIEDAYFDYDKASLRPDAMNTLKADSTELRDILKDFPDYKITIEGLCDERGSAEYNMALGQKRAEAARDYLTQIGIPADQFKLVSYGKEKANAECKDESCWQKDRHVHFVAMANQ
ncbi:MAG TPA: OmpA family protein [Bryobacteraceae bacterium]|nr:OmpA family protein [Bryobacteraceae bacterium]